MRLNDNANHAIYGTAITGLTVNTVLVDGLNGSNPLGTLSEGVVHLDDSGGTVTIANSNFSGAAHTTVIADNSGSSPNLTMNVSNTVFGTMQGSTADVRGSALVVISEAGTANLTATNNSFTYWWGNAIQMIVTAGSGSGNATITGNSVINSSGALAGSGGIWMSGGQLTFAINNNIVQKTNGTAISVDRSPYSAGIMSGTVSGNQIGLSGVANSGSEVGMAVYASHTGPGTTTIAITNNIIRQINSSQAIWVLAGDNVGGGGAGRMNATITGNNISESGTTPSTNRFAIYAQVGRSSNGGVNPDTDVMCLDLGGDGAAANIVTNFTSTSRTNALRVQQRFQTTMQLRGYTGLTNDNFAVQNYLNARNANQTPIGTIAQNEVASGGFGFTNTPGGAACSQP
jgi:hypothetical protein